MSEQLITEQLIKWGWAEWGSFFVGLAAIPLLDRIIRKFVVDPIHAVKLKLPIELDPAITQPIMDAMKYGEWQKQTCRTRTAENPKTPTYPIFLFNPGEMLGYLEWILFFVSIWFGKYIAIGGWLAFKLGSKWQTWQHIIKVRETLVGDDPLMNLQVLSACGSYQMGRFLIGTLYNVLLALLGVFIGTACLRLLCPPIWPPFWQP